MAFSRPTLQQLIERAQADIESRLPGTDPRLRRSLLGALARAHADAVHGLYGALDWQARQVLPDTAEAEYLARHADIYRMRRLAATAATGTITCTGLDASVIPAGTTWQDSLGRAYAADADATIAGGAATVTVTAVEAGDAGNQPGGVKLTLVSPVTGVQSQAAVDAGGLTGGADTESDDRLRDRLLTHMRRQAMGGSAADYIQWALDAHPDVARVFPSKEQGASTVVVRILTADLADPFPSAALLATVQAYIDERRPITAEVFVWAPVPKTIDITLHVEPDTAAVRDAVAAELADLFGRLAPGETVRRSHLSEAIGTASGEEWHTLVAPADDIECLPGELPVLGTITWS